MQFSFLIQAILNYKYEMIFAMFNLGPVSLY